MTGREKKKKREELCEQGVNLISQDAVRLLDVLAGFDLFADILIFELNTGQSFLSLLI